MRKHAMGYVFPLKPAFAEKRKMIQVGSDGYVLGELFGESDVFHSLPKKIEIRSIYVEVAAGLEYPISAFEDRNKRAVINMLAEVQGADDVELVCVLRAELEDILAVECGIRDAGFIAKPFCLRNEIRREVDAIVRLDLPVYQMQKCAAAAPEVHNAVLRSQVH